MSRKFGILALLLVSGACGPKTGTGGATDPQFTYDGPTTRFIGRVNAANPVMTWAGTAVETRFQGDSVTVNVAANGTNSNNYVDLIIDGNTTTRYQVNGQPIVQSGLATGTHTARLVKTTEENYGDFTFNGFTVDKALPTHVPTHSIEFIGDSITVGYGVTGTDYTKDGTPADEDSDQSFASVTANKFGADFSLIAWSGRGVSRNQPGAESSPTIPQIWPLSNPSDPTSSWDFKAQPDAVVINLGTNDFSQSGVQSLPPGDTFVTAYKQFVASIRSKYPKAHLFFCVGPMLTDNDAVKAQTAQRDAVQSVQATDNNSTFVDFGVQDTSPQNLGAAYHPNPAEHKKMALTLEGKIESALGWTAVAQ